jgi:hypothetical protein
MQGKSFRSFFEAYMDEEKADIERTLAKLPPSHAALVKGYNWKFHSGNTLAGDNQHVGYIDDNNKEIAVAAPYNYGREFTILHEIAHKVYAHFLTPQLKHEWSKIVARTNHPQKQEDEELFCHAFASAYVKHPPLTHAHKEWMDFIRRLPH